MKELKIQKAEGRIIIKNGRVIDPANQRDEVTDIVIKDGVIESIGKTDNAKSGAQVIDATEIGRAHV